MADDMDEKADKAEAKAIKEDARAAGYEGKSGSKWAISTARKAAERWRKAAATMRQDAERLRRLADAEVTPLEATAEEPALASREPAPDFTEQLARLAELKASGDLSEDEFATAKARLLG